VHRLLAAAVVAIIMMGLSACSSTQDGSAGSAASPASSATSTPSGSPAAEAGGAAASRPSAAPAAPSPDAEPQEFSQVVGKVNGRPLYRAFYEQNLDYIRSRIPIGGRAQNTEMYLNAPFNALERLVDDELIDQEARREGMAASDAEVQAEYDRAAKAAGGERYFLVNLQAQHISKKMAIEGMRKRLTVDRYTKEKLEAGITVSDDDAVAYYNGDLSKYKSELWIKVFHILVRCRRDAPSNEVESARKRIEKILANIRAGEPFETMAREFSEDKTANLGGSIGFLKSGVTYPEFDAVAFSLQPGQVSDPVRTEVGFHIIKVQERRGGELKPFEEVKDDCKMRAMTAKQAAVLEAALSRLRASADIERLIQ
jgi:peptidyl-prolyl cis-trans isomerase C